MKAKLRWVARRGYAVLALALASAGLLPMLYSHAFAFGQVTSRSIKMSSAHAGATGVTYLITFTPATTATTVKGIVIDFCSNDPLPGDSCTAPTGFTVGAPTVTAATITGETVSFTASSVNSGRTLELTDGTATGTPSGAASITLTTATNPTSAVGTFYARIFTFGATADVTTWNGTANGSATTNVVDAGGVAMSTVTDINITARVMEQLTFCTSSTDISASSCASATTPVDLTIGHTSGGGSTAAIDSTAVDAASAWTQLSTNATNGAIVRMKDLTIGAGNCGGLTRNNGSTCEIPSAASVSGTPTVAASITKGTAEFGMCVVPNVSGSGISADAPYNDGGTSNCTATATPAMTGNNTTAKYGLDDSTASDNVVTTYGDTIFHCTAPISQTTSALNFAATAALTTPAGIYTQSESLIATGTF